MNDAFLFRLDGTSSCYFLLISPESLVLLQSILESWEGLGVLRTLCSDIGLLVLVFCHDQQKDVESLLWSLEPCWQSRMLQIQEAEELLQSRGLQLCPKFILGEDA